MQSLRNLAVGNKKKKRLLCNIRAKMGAAVLTVANVNVLKACWQQQLQPNLNLG